MPRGEALASDNMALLLFFFKFHNLWKFSCRSFKSRKNRGYRGSFLAICNFVFSSSISNLVLWIFLSTGTRRNTNMFNGSANLTKFHRKKSHNSYPKDPYLLCRKALRNGIELRHDRYLNMRRLSILLPFGNLSRCFLFGWPLFQT